MMRAFLLISVAAGLFALSAGGAGAQAPSQVKPQSACPRDVVKIYFASGAVTASPQAQALIGKIGETASDCEPDHIDLVTRFDPSTDGDRAVNVALERLA